MNIVINAVLSFDKPRGVGRYINNLLPAIAELDKNNEYYIYYGKWMKEYEFLKIQQDNFHFIELDIKNKQLTRNLYLAFVLPLLCKKHKPDFLFLIDTQAIAIKPCRVVSTIHDLAEFVVPEKYSKKQAFIRRLIVKNQVHISDCILTVSNYSKKDICKRFSLKSDKVHVTYNAVEFNQEEKLNLEPENYFLFVSEIERAKNLSALIEAYNMLDSDIKDNFRIKVVGKKGNSYDETLKKIEEYNMVDKVEFYGYVTDEELELLYRKAYVFVFPSLFEGFGLPVLEAMAKGVPVICSNSSSIPEVGGNAVLTFEPNDAKELCRQLTKVVNDLRLRALMIEEGYTQAKKFTKTNAATSTLKVFHDLLRGMGI